jgi:hypothetical protein
MACLGQVDERSARLILVRSLVDLDFRNTILHSPSASCPREDLRTSSLDLRAPPQWFLEQLGWQGRAEDWGVAIDAAIDQVAALVTESGWAEHLERSMDR